MSNTEFSVIARRSLKISGLQRGLSSNQLSYEPTDVGSWSFVGSNVPVINESMNVMQCAFLLFLAFPALYSEKGRICLRTPTR